MIAQPIPQIPDVGDSALKLAIMNRAVAGTIDDLSDTAESSTLVGAVSHERVGVKVPATGNYVHKTSGSSLPSGFPYTISLWVQPLTLTSSSSGVLFFMARSGTGSIMVGILFNEDGKFAMRSTSSNSEVGAVAVDIGSWNHIVGVFASATDFRMYLNGVLDLTHSSPSAYSLLQNWAVGRIPDSTPSENTQDFNIEDVRLYHRELSTSEITAMVRAGVPDASLKLLTLGGVNAEDFSVHRKHGTQVGGVTYTRKGADFDGVDGKIGYGNIGNIQEVRLWVDLESTTEQLFKTDAGAFVHVSGGIVTYDSPLSAVATYVNGVPTTTMVGGKWERLICQFDTEAAADFELGTDGTSFGAFKASRLSVRDALASAREAALDYEQTEVLY